MDDARDEGVGTPLTWRSALLAALLAVLARPSTWLVGLVGFLARGGIVVLALPIVVLPSAPGLANAIAPTLTPFYFGQVSPSFVMLVAAVAGATAGSIVLGGLAGAWADATLARWAAREDELGLVSPAAGEVVRRSLVARLLAYLPLALALSWGALRIVDAVYREVILPDELATPIVLRVLRDVPDAVLLVVGAWLFGEVVGGAAERRIVLAGSSIPRAIGGALARVVRSPATTLGTTVVTTLVVGLAALLPALAAGVAWNRAASLLAAGAGAVEVTIATTLFVALWLVGLVLTGVAVAWRAYAWTFELFRTAAARPASVGVHARGDGTIGPAGGRRPGEWPSPEGSGRL